MSSRHVRLTAAVIALVQVSFALPALADPSAGDKALAQSLFDDGKKLMAAEKYAEACPKLAESQHLDPGLGTLLNLAVCHEKEGRTATAWAEFNDAVSQAKKENNAPREAFAREHIAALEPKLSRVTITVTPASASVAGLEVKLDGARIGKAAWGSSMPVDPGKHAIDATAPGKKPWSGSITVGADGDKQAATVPALEDAPAAGGVATPGGGAPAVTPTTTPATPVGGSASDAAAEDGSGRRTLGLVVGGVGVVALGIGGFFGLRAMSKWDERKENCPGGACNATAVEAGSDAKSAANVANLGVGLGLVAIGVGVVLFITAPSGDKPKAPTTGFRVVPQATTSSGGLHVVGTF